MPVRDQGAVVRFRPMLPTILRSAASIWFAGAWVSGTMGSARPLKHSRLAHHSRHRKAIAAMIVVARLSPRPRSGRSGCAARGVEHAPLRQHGHAAQLEPGDRRGRRRPDHDAALFAHVDVGAEAEQVLPGKAQFLALPRACRGTTHLTRRRRSGSSCRRGSSGRLWQEANKQARTSRSSRLSGEAEPVHRPLT